MDLLFSSTSWFGQPGKVCLPLWPLGTQPQTLICQLLSKPLWVRSYEYKEFRQAGYDERWKMGRILKEYKKQRAHHEDERGVCMCVGYSVSKKIYWNQRFNIQAMAKKLLWWGKTRRLWMSCIAGRVPQDQCWWNKLFSLSCWKVMLKPELYAEPRVK